VTEEGTRRALAEGSALAAPTAPHATLRAGTLARSGPERFWSRRPVRIASAVALAVSAGLHALLFPLELHPLEITEVEGEASIAIDVLSAVDVPPSDPTVRSEGSPAQPPAVDDGEQARRHDAGVGGRTGVRDAAATSAADAVSLEASDAAIARFDAGPAPDAEALISALQTDRVLVMLVINAEVIRKNPVGATLGYLLRALPQWDQFMAGTTLDPVRDIDWIVISGPSLVNTERDVVLVHYSAPDTTMDRAVAAIGRRYTGGGFIDAGVRGVKATLAHADRAERVILRPQSRVLAVVPPSAASKVARQLVGARVTAPIREGDAVYLRFVSPHRAIADLPDSIHELRLRVVPRADEGADVYVDGDTDDAAAAAAAAAQVARFVRRHNDTLTSLVTHGLLDHVETSSEGSSLKVHLTVTRDQIATLVALVGDVLGVQPGEARPAATPAGRLGAPPRLR
jgi:hypothetical protein